MRALDLLRHLRFRLQLEIIALPNCEALRKTDMVLGMYEGMVLHVGVADKEIGPHVTEAFEKLFRVAREYAAEEAGVSKANGATNARFLDLGVSPSDAVLPARLTDPTPAWVRRLFGPLTNKRGKLAVSPNL